MHITETEQTSAIKTHYMALNRLGNTQLKEILYLSRSHDLTT